MSWLKTAENDDVIMTRVHWIYPFVLTPEPSGGFVAQSRDLPEAITQGDDLASTLEAAEGALQAAIEEHLARSEDFTLPSKVRKGEYGIPVPLTTAMKASLHLAMRAQGIKKTELARTLGLDEKEVRRMLDLHYNTKAPSLERALSALGKKVSLQID